MARSKEEIISEMVDSGLFNDQEIRDAAAKSNSSIPETSSDTTFTQGMFKTYKSGEVNTPLRKADVGVGNVAKFALNALKLPYDLAGEAITVPIEQRSFRSPSLLGGENPADPIATINKLLRGGAGAISSLLSGNNPMQGANAAYNAPRGTMGIIEDTAMAALLGKVAPEVLSAPVDAATAAVSKTLETGKDLAASATKKVIRAGLGPTEKAQEILFQRPQDVSRQTNFSDLGDKLAQTTNDLSQKLDQLDNNAWDTLLKLKSEPQSKLINILKNVKSDFVGTGKTKIGNADRQAAAQIDDYIQRIKDIKQPGATPGTEQFLDQPQIKNIVQSIQKDANYSLPESDPVNMAVKAARAKIDEYLKGQNTGYEEAMKPVADATSALKDTVKRFRLEHKTNEGFLPTSTTVTKLQNVVKDKNPEISRTLEQLKNVTGIDFGDEALLTSVKQEFTPGVQRTNGSRRTMAGSAIGAAAGTTLAHTFGLPTSVAAGVGGAVGAGAGALADYYGGSASQKIIDFLSKTNSGVGNVLSAINQKSQGTAFQDVIKRLIAGEPALGKLISGNQ